MLSYIVSEGDPGHPELLYGASGTVIGWIPKEPSASPIAPSLVAASIAWMRTNNGGIVAEQFCDTAAQEKFFSDEAIDVPLPYLVFEETAGEKEFESGGAWVERGVIMIRIYAAPKTTARFLGDAVIASLQDAPLVFSGGDLLYWRPREPSFVPSGEVAPGEVPAEYCRLVGFEYIIEGKTIGNPV